MDVDLHLGQAKTFLIYGPREDGLNCLLDTRPAPSAGSGEARWDQLAETLQDCFALLAASAGQRPRKFLAVMAFGSSSPRRTSRERWMCSTVVARRINVNKITS
jgi:hypothetical protein